LQLQQLEKHEQLQQQQQEQQQELQQLQQQQSQPQTKEQKIASALDTNRKKRGEVEEEGSVGRMSKASHPRVGASLLGNLVGFAFGDAPDTNQSKEREKEEEEEEEEERKTGEEKMTFREPDAWEKNLVCLEAGKWTGEMESKVFKRYMKKERTFVADVSFEGKLDLQEHTPPSGRPRSRTYGDLPAALGSEIEELKLFNNLLNECKQQRQEREPTKLTVSSPTLTKPPSASVPSLTTRSLSSSTKVEESPSFEYPFSLPSDTDSLSLLRYFQELRKKHVEVLEQHFYLRCVMIKSGRLKSGLPCNVPISTLLQPGLHVPMTEWDSWINQQMDGWP